ncbi:hypothetical protein KVT40_003536 [Elsinoe batatas]|uniref:DUF2461 domain-containing protein n=1 Tax=Elsinoe batatas TaxID=2601811 RepID=A0A8K0PH57_9PEZI|nr:hypothetical protein KVT40_003536 [Elsinoe batatas]
MARRSGRLSGIRNESSETVNQASKKRSRSDMAPTPRATKQAKKTTTTSSDSTPRASTRQKTTPKKSQHFTDKPKREYDDATGLTSTDEGDDDAEDESDFSAAEANGKTSDHDDASDEDDEEDTEEPEISSEDDDKKRRRSKGRPAPKTQAKAQRDVYKAYGKQASLILPARDGLNGSGSNGYGNGEEELPEPGTELVIKKPKAKPAGKTPYKDERVHSNTLEFLGELRDNNRREWLKFHDPEFRQAENDWKSFVEKLTEKLTEVDDEIPELPVKDIVFRIYRDVRFSPDPTPYKAYFSAAWSRTGRKGPYAAYYIQISPGQSFLGGGSWFPESQPLARLRTNIDRRPADLKSILMNERLRKEFLNGAPKNEKKVVQAFTLSKMNAESALKTRPQGYAKDHVDIGLLRLKNFTIGRQLTDEEVVSPGFLELVADLMGVMKPFIRYLNSIVMPDPDAEEGDESSDGSSDGEENSGSGDE